MISTLNSFVLVLDQSGVKGMCNYTHTNYSESLPNVAWGKLVWFTQCIPSHMFIVWLAIQGRLQTQDRMVLWNNGYKMRCSLRNVCMESHAHLFFNCPNSGKIWDSLKLIIHENALPND
ncbi:reverse transcriptase zinc-binding domain-containing protein [Tanacetum coccineum]